MNRSRIASVLSQISKLIENSRDVPKESLRVDLAHLRSATAGNESSYRYLVSRFLDHNESSSLSQVIHGLISQGVYPPHLSKVSSGRYIGSFDSGIKLEVRVSSDREPVVLVGGRIASSPEEASKILSYLNRNAGAHTKPHEVINFQNTTFVLPDNMQGDLHHSITRDKLRNMLKDLNSELVTSSPFKIIVPESLYKELSHPRNYHDPVAVSLREQFPDLDWVSDWVTEIDIKEAWDINKLELNGGTHSVNEYGHPNPYLVYEGKRIMFVDNFGQYGETPFQNSKSDMVSMVKAYGGEVVTQNPDIVVVPEGAWDGLNEGQIDEALKPYGIWSGDAVNEDDFVAGFNEKYMGILNK
jgi:hypothetical protein